MIPNLAKFLAPGANFARGCFHEVEAVATTVDNIPAAIFALSRDPGEGGKLWGLAVVKGGCELRWVICRQETSTTWRTGQAEIGGWQTQFCQANAQMLADGVLRAVEVLGILGRFLPEETVVAAKIFPPEPSVYRRDELIRVLATAESRSGFTHVYLGSSLCSIGAAIRILRERFAVSDTVHVYTRDVIDLPMMYG